MTIDPLKMNRHMMRSELSVWKVAYLADIPEHRFRRILTGHAHPTDDELAAMAMVLDCTVADITPHHARLGDDRPVS